MSQFTRSTDWFSCPHCGEQVSSEARFCRACGADEECGWNDQAFEPDDDSFDDPDDFDYEQFVAREFPDHARPEVVLTNRWVAVVVLAIVVSLILTIIPV